MKILIICSKNSGRVAPFITDQVEALQKAGVTCEYFTVEGKGVAGYLRNYSPMKRKIREFHPDLIHAHYGLSGLLANLQRKVPVVTTYHGSDINNQKVRQFSRIAIRLSAWNIFVSQKNIQSAGVKKSFSMIPCGVDTTIFKPLDKVTARKNLNFDANARLILFAGAFDNKVKNPELAIEAVKKIPDARLLEMKGYSRSQVAELMNAVDVCLMTSFTEGSPQFVKEALACNCPVVSVDVGDVIEMTEGVAGCYIAERNAGDIAQKLKLVFEKQKRTDGREAIISRKLDQMSVINQIYSIYKSLLK